MTTNTKERAAQNELRVLEAIAKFGVLMVKDIAAIAFRDAASEASAINMTNRTLARLMKFGQVSRKESIFTWWYYLQESGARRCNDDLNDRGQGAFARYGGHLSVWSSIDRRRCISEAARNLSKNGFEVMGQFGLFMIDEDLKDFDMFAMKKKKNGSYTLGVVIALNVKDTGKIVKRCLALAQHCNKILIHGRHEDCQKLLATARNIEQLKGKLILLRDE